MQSTWIESGRQGAGGRTGPGRDVVGRGDRHPPRSRRASSSGLRSRPTTSPSAGFPAYWTENRGVNSHWHVPIPPQAVGATAPLSERAHRTQGDGEAVYSPHPEHDRPAQPARAGPSRPRSSRSAPRRLDRQPDDDRPGRRPGVDPGHLFPHGRASIPTSVPAQGDLPQGRSHFRAIVGGLAIRRPPRLVHRAARLAGLPALPGGDQPPRHRTDLASRSGPGLLMTDLVAMGDCLPRTDGGTASPGQYLKRFRVVNDGPDDLDDAVRRLHPERGQRRDRRARPELE